MARPTRKAPPTLKAGVNPVSGRAYVAGFGPGDDHLHPFKETPQIPEGDPRGNTPPVDPGDWATAFFGSLGLPPDVTENVNKIFTQYSDTNAASAAALSYIRGTPWYQQTYPGIAEGIRKGIVANEADYRNLLNRQSQLYKRYLGRDVTATEFANNLTEGVDLATVGGRLQGAALAGAYGNDWRYTLGAFDSGRPSDAEVKALGETEAGLDSPLGIQVKRRLDLAQQRLAGVFRGTLATPAMSLATGRLSAPGLATSPPDVAA